MYLWSGWQEHYPQVHNGETKQRYNSHVEILNLTTGNWRQCTTTGNPPLSVVGYGSAAIGNNIIYFGGWCGHEGCYHNSVHSLCVDTMHWKELSPTNRHAGPMMKCYGGTIAVKIDGKNYLLVIGGQGTSVNTPHQDNAQYINKVKERSHLIRTNEQNYFDLSTGKFKNIHFIL